MDLNAQQYYDAGLQRLEEAKALYLRGSSYSLSVYCAGLAVECLLRAFRFEFDKTFDGRHDLDRLFAASGILSRSEESLRRRGKSDVEIRDASRTLKTAVQEIIAVWHNNLRFASDARYRSHLRAVGRLQGIKGDAVKRNAEMAIGAAVEIIDQGATLWNSKQK
jgi:hypothetical protein